MVGVFKKLGHSEFFHAEFRLVVERQRTAVHDGRALFQMVTAEVTAHVAYEAVVAYAAVGQHGVAQT